MAQKTTNKQKTKPVQKLQFTKSPTGRFNLGYSAGDVITVSVLGKTKCDELVDADYATYVK